MLFAANDMWWLLGIPVMLGVLAVALRQVAKEFGKGLTGAPEKLFADPGIHDQFIYGCTKCRTYFPGHWSLMKCPECFDKDGTRHPLSSVQATWLAHHTQRWYKPWTWYRGVWMSEYGNEYAYGGMDEILRLYEGHEPNVVRTIRERRAAEAASELSLQELKDLTKSWPERQAAAAALYDDKFAAERAQENAALDLQFGEADVECEREANFTAACESFHGEEEVVRLFGPGTHGAHEAVDRLAMLASITEAWLLNAPAIVMNKDAFRRVFIANRLLNEAYGCVDSVIPPAEAPVTDPEERLP